MLWGDQIVLVSQKFGMFLHTSKESFEDGRREVNGSNETERISFRAIPYAAFVKDSQAFLQAGEVVRLYHKECEGYLTNEKEQDSEDHRENGAAWGR